MPLFRMLRRACLLLPLLAPLAKAEPQYGTSPANPGKPLYRLAIHPLHNPAKLAETYLPLVALLNRKVANAHFELEASRDYQVYENKLRARQPELLLPNPWQTLQAIKVGYQVIAMAGDAADFKGLLIVRKDSRITRPGDLKGKVVSYPSHTALAACMMVQMYLQQHKLNVMSDIENRYVGSQESSLMNVFLGQSSAGATWPPPWRIFQKDHPQEAAQLQVLLETPPLINNSLMVRDDVPAAVREQVRATVLSLKDSAEGRAILAKMQGGDFHPANNGTYAVVRDYITRFEREVRPVEQR